jgi:WD40 repeat protein
VNCAIFSSDGKYILSGDKLGAVYCWDPANSAAEPVPVRKFLAPSGGVLCLASDGDWLLSGDADGAVHLWNMNRDGEVTAFKHDGGPVLAVAFVGKSSALSVHSNGSIYRWNVKNWRK